MNMRLTLGRPRSLSATVVVVMLAASAPVRAAEPVPPPVPPPPKSPVATFRQLLTMNPAERAAALAGRPEAQRAFLESRMAEYGALPPDLREARLRATDLYWHLQQLLGRLPADRGGLLEAAPAELQEVLRERLALWDRLPPGERASLLQHERAIRHLAQTRPVQGPPLPPGYGPAGGASLMAGPPIPLRLQAELTRLAALAPEERRRLGEQWHRFFAEAPSPGRDRALRAMDAGERREMEEALDRFRRLAPDQRHACVDAFARLTAMSATDRADFLRRAERWEALPPEDRQAWRQLVLKLPIAPPLPIDPNQPPLPPSPPRRHLVTGNDTGDGGSR